MARSVSFADGAVKLGGEGPPNEESGHCGEDSHGGEKRGRQEVEAQAVHE